MSTAIESPRPSTGLLRSFRKKLSLKRRSIAILRFDRIRFWFVRLRYAWLKNTLKYSNDQTAHIGEKTITHNLSAFNTNAVFGCGGRMGTLIYPVVSYYVSNREKVKILIVGCRTEDDIYWLRSYGFTKTYGFDLFSYSKNVFVGDIHRTTFEDKSFDVVLLAWMISYSKDPACVFKECRRILKTDGLIGVSLDHNPMQEKEGVGPVRANGLNSTGDIIKLLDATMRHKVVFEYDHYQENEAGTVVISKVLA